MERRLFFKASLASAALLTLPLASPALAKTTDRRPHSLLVHKAGRSLFLVNRQGQFLKQYSIALGSNPIGHKRREGDGRTPEGAYKLAYEVPNSDFHLSFNISYPNKTDRVNARRRGVSPGGDICLHGTGGRPARGDWTAGCVALSDRDMEDIHRFLRPGMPISLQP